MRDGVERNLAAKVRGVVAGDFGRKRMSRLVAGGREKENDVIDEAKGQELGVKFGISK